MKYLMLLFVAFSSVAYGEPFYPALSPAKVDSLRRQLRQSRPDTSRVKLLLALSNNLSSIIYDADMDVTSYSDTVLAYVKQAQRLSDKLGFVTGQIDSKYAIAYYLVCNNEGQKREIREAAQSGLVISQQYHNAYREAIGWYLLNASYNSSLSELGQRLQGFKKAVHLFRATHHPQQEAFVLKEIADTHLQQGQLLLARRELLQVLTIYQRCGYPNLHYTFDLLSAVNSNIADYQQAMYYALAAVRSAKRTQDTVSLFTFYSRVGTICTSIDQLEQAIYYNRLGLRNAESIHSPVRAMNASQVIVANLLVLNKPKQALALLLQKSRDYPPSDNRARLYLACGLTRCYLAMQQYAQAGAICIQMLALMKQHRMQDNYYENSLQAEVYSAIGRYYLATHNYANAKLMLTKTLAITEQRGFLPNIVSLQLTLFRIDSAQGNLSAAITHYKRYKALNDSIFSEKTSKQMAVLRVQNETAKREHHIALLTKQTQAQQANIKRQQTQRNAGLASAGLFLLLLGVSYNRYLIKQRSNQLLEAKQREIDQQNHSLEQVLAEKEDLLVEKEWMLKEIHHRVKNNLQIVNELLASQTDYLRDAHTLAIVRESQNRIQAMALIHQKLYQAQSIARVNMQEYIREIVEHLVVSFDREDSVRVCLEVSAIELDVALATPLGLIINEVVTNSLKYAFPDGRTGNITIGLTRVAPTNYQLLLADDGIGLPPGLQIASTRTLGMTMLHGLSDQLNATLTFEPGPGVRICLEFEAARKVAPPAWAA
jgi:two-component sensor histidine kinase